MSNYSLQEIRAQILATTKPTPPREISGTIALTPEEDSICALLDKFTKYLRESDETYAGVECRIAGGWVRDKVSKAMSLDVSCNQHMLYQVARNPE
jgi:hypothetical protein